VEEDCRTMNEFQEESYHGWTIQVAQTPSGYVFQCLLLEQGIRLTNAQHYFTLEQALSAGRLRADLESVRFSLTTFLRGKFQLLLLNADERSALEHSIEQYIERAQPQFY